jgi:transcriptional regulator with XRE-family HTH domain
VDSPADIFQRILDKRKLSQRDFCAIIGKREPTVSMYMTKARKISVKTGEKWADVLGLIGPERDAFLDAVHLSAASPRVRAMVARLERENRRLKKRLHQ